MPDGRFSPDGPWHQSSQCGRGDPDQTVASGRPVANVAVRSDSARVSRKHFWDSQAATHLCPVCRDSLSFRNTLYTVSATISVAFKMLFSLLLLLPFAIIASAIPAPASDPNYKYSCTNIGFDAKTNILDFWCKINAGAARHGWVDVDQCITNRGGVILADSG